MARKLGLQGSHRARRGERCFQALAAAAVALAVAALCWPVVDAAAGGEQVTATGEIVDLACYLPLGDKARGPAHADCAEMCAKEGAPLGLLGADGSVLLLVAEHGKPGPYGEARKLAGKKAEVAGSKVSRGGIAGLVVSAAKGL